MDPVIIITSEIRKKARTYPKKTEKSKYTFITWFFFYEKTKTMLIYFNLVHFLKINNDLIENGTARPHIYIIL